MTRSLYVLGGAGTGKSTFTAQLLDAIDQPMSPLGDLHQRPNARGTIITLRGHLISPDGLYLGCMRQLYPGTDGLDRASSIAGEEWLMTGQHSQLTYIIAEGATLSTRRFLTALNEQTDLLLVHLRCDDWVRELRFAERGSAQDGGWIKNTTTRATNLLTAMTELGAAALDVDTADPAEWDLALAASLTHVQGDD
jgi:hypothetical protein